jgi:hypothetical protein
MTKQREFREQLPKSTWTCAGADHDQTAKRPVDHFGLPNRSTHLTIGALKGLRPPAHVIQGSSGRDA